MQHGGDLGDLHGKIDKFAVIFNVFGTRDRRQDHTMQRLADPLAELSQYFQSGPSRLALKSVFAQRQFVQVLERCWSTCHWAALSIYTYIFNYTHVLVLLHMYTHTHTHVYAQPHTRGGGGGGAIVYSLNKKEKNSHHHLLLETLLTLHRGLCWCVFVFLLCVDG